MPEQYYGIRHHGPGSARMVRAALDVVRPQLVLVEGPPDADNLVPHVRELTPPVALPREEHDLIPAPTAEELQGFEPVGGIRRRDLERCGNRNRIASKRIRTSPISANRVPRRS